MSTFPSIAATHDDHPCAEGFGRGRPVKKTTSLCPSCLKRIPASVFERQGEIWLDKQCADHGLFSALLSSDPRHYHTPNPQGLSSGACCGPGQSCGPPVDNHSCNVLVEVTRRCNLACPTSYADSSPERTEQLDLAAFETLLDRLLEQGKADADLLQLSGGEPTIHPRFFDMVELALAKGFGQVYVNTNGIRLARPEFARRLADYGRRVAVYLQLDGVSREVSERLRGDGDLALTKLRALDLCEELRIRTVPVLTFTPGVNDDELGELLRLAMSRPRSVDRVMIHPAMYSGRYDNPRLVRRATVADVVRALERQTDGLFTPIPCGDPNCFSMALALRSGSELLPISRYLPAYADWGRPGTAEAVASVTDRFDSTAALSDRFAIGIKPFMDAYTFDQDRVDGCCVHVADRDGNPVSFCEYNAVRRPGGRP